MHNDEGNVSKSRLHAMQGMVKNIPSVLSNNRTILAVLAFLYILPLVTTAGISPVRALLFLLTQIMIFGLLAMSFDLQLGRAALLNFGHVALFGLGAYIMAFTLDADMLPPPFNIIAAVPYPLTLFLAMSIGGLLGLIMGLTTSRMRGTAFAFIALAIAMFIYNFFVENPDISGGETGLRVATPDIIRTAPFYLLFVTLAIVFFAAFLGMIIFYLKKRTESIGLILFTPVMIAFTGLLLIFATNILGPVLVFISFLGMILVYWIERNRVLTDPLQYSVQTQVGPNEQKSMNSVINFIIPIGVVAIGVIGLVVSFESNITQMVALWIGDTSTFYFTIPVQYYLVLTCLVATYIFIKRIIASPFGRMVAAVAQNEERAEALGYDSYRAKIVVLIMSGAIAGLAGALYAPYIRTIDPTTALGVGVTIDAMLFTIIGGIGTLFGPILGAGVIVYSELNLVDFITEGLGLPGRLWLVGLGVIYVIIVLFLPLGIVGSIGKKTGALKEKFSRFKLGGFEFGLKDSDYWVFGFLGVLGLFLFLLEEMRSSLLALGIWILWGLVLLQILWVYRKEIVTRTRRLPSKLKASISKLIRIKRG